MKTIIFDLDGTLLPIDQERFVHTYFQLIAARLSKKGVDPKGLISAIMEGTMSMLKNDGSKTNEDAFWLRFKAVHHGPDLDYPKEFSDFYTHDFDQLKSLVNPSLNSKELIEGLKQRGFNLILATNPLFPLIAIVKRMAWIGLSPKDFSCITSLENCHYSKPNPNYYLEILTKQNLSPEDIDCIVGNDPKDDMWLTTQGVKGFIVTDHLINGHIDTPYTYEKGSFKELENWLLGSQI